MIMIDTSYEYDVVMNFLVNLKLLTDRSGDLQRHALLYIAAPPFYNFHQMMP